MTVAVSGDNITFPDNSVQATAPKVGMVNRVINGGMTIDQRNAGASVTPITSNQYLVDRFYAVLTQASKFSAQQNAGAVTPPAGFTNYQGVTSLSAYSILTGDAFAVRQSIEGFNIADLGWGTASAQAVTISFWVRSSLTGSFGANIANNAFNRSYPFSYTINVANTWEQKTVTIPGDTTGTWLTTNASGISLTFGLGYGASLSGTANVWNAGTAFMPTGAVSVVGTSGATFYITGVQLEKGSTATSFDYRPYGTELGLCQRYCFVPVPSGAIVNGTIAGSGSGADCYFRFPVTMRSSPTLTSNPSLANITTYSYSGAVAKGTTSLATAAASADKIIVSPSWTGALTAGLGVVMDASTGSFVFSAEL